MAESETTRRLLDAARDFQIGSQLLAAQSGQAAFPLRSTIVTRAISIELYLKYLDVKSTGRSALRTHDLEALYVRLAPATRNLIDQHYRHAQPIRNVLRTYKDIFEDWRDLYEHQGNDLLLDWEGLEGVGAALEAASEVV